MTDLQALIALGTSDEAATWTKEEEKAYCEAVLEAVVADAVERIVSGQATPKDMASVIDAVGGDTAAFVKDRIFRELIERYQDLHESDEDAAARAFSGAIVFGPQEFTDLVHKGAVEFGLMPATPDGYNDAGERVYLLSGILERTGQQLSDVPPEILAQASTAPFHRVQ